MKRTISVVALGVLALASAAAPAQTQHGPGMTRATTHNHGASQDGRRRLKGDKSPASLAFRAANAKMHKQMNIAYSGNSDVDFVKGMIPHHQGAVEMAKVVLAFGKDPEVKKLAEGIIKAQEEEIAWMRNWLQKHRQQP